ncbi:unnamed protein product [marine sediment metagenome]|uniref:Phage gp6-like head-tail connector protein n=1 Tax=marine sediment metagenome TaxID=412755 RepID=X0ZW64_9ZZZZ
MPYISLNEAKEHCRVELDFLEDDFYITSLIKVAESAVSHHIHEDLAVLEVEGILDPTLIQAIKLMVGHFYDSREPTVRGLSIAKVPMTVEYLLDNDWNRTIA